MIDLLINIISWLLLIVGGFFLFIGSLGLIKFQDFWSRLHAVSMIDSAGVGLIIGGLMLQTGLSFVTIKFAIIVIFLFLTGPTASHAIANAAFVSGCRPSKILDLDIDKEDNFLKLKVKVKEKTIG
ncbi:monovalent cation/H(+) antiporter subunit G [Candidatus Endowatersipora endosymbiont of Watersipora subatra]|uniref:monovalent cation/H(+) antiporter subunit G n=1 Tax=Candidatus Endowatersipora endosymbiont of Watersipora subatra TaxID=3077946 RepID=UPI00312CAF85